MTARLTMPMAAAMALAAVVAGCGGGSGDSSTVSAPTVTTSSLTKAQFVKQANAECQSERVKLPYRMNKFDEQHPSEGQHESERFTAQVKGALLPTIEAEIEKVRELGAPAGDEESVEAILSAQRAAVDESKAQKTISFPNGVQKYFEAPAKLMRAYGLTSCEINFTLSPENAEAANR